MKVILLLYFQQYCTCYGSGLADRLTKREIETGSDAVTGPVIREVSRTCYAMIKAAAMKELEGRKQPQWHGYLFDNSAAKNDPAEALTS
ncbi:MULTISPECIES: hypothetical protein [unclassified Bradyrhizobium]|uniref:hypothetical protein n=1 Tax=unclassified Bradyrhizobium TaxID=2631580 RepID=UPI002916DE54|nr:MULTISPECIES: hypothetical protein [unclassified Bradyrhizobium]